MASGMKWLFRNLSSRLILAFILVIIVTTLAAGIPTYLFIRNELDLQVWARVDDGSRVTQTLLQAEESRLINLAALTAERPTLRSILEKGDLAELEEYLNLAKEAGNKIEKESDREYFLSELKTIET